MPIEKIISGGQTGADRAGVDAAIESGIPYGGWLPKGRTAEDGTVPEKYSAMQEMNRGGYPKRTEQNVIDSDGTVIFSHGKPVTGSALTIKLARKHQRPWLYIDLGSRESKAPGIYNQVKDILTQILGYPDHEEDRNVVADVVMEFAVMD